MDQEKRDSYEKRDSFEKNGSYEKNDSGNCRDTFEKQSMEETVSQKINWVEPEERYVNQGEFIGPNTYRTGKMDRDAETFG